jgi:hypothetical protein
MGHFHYHATEPVFANKWKLCAVADNDCPRIGTTPDPDIAPAHGIARPLIVNGCPVSPCAECGTLWTDAYLDYCDSTYRLLCYPCRDGAIQ